MRNNALVVLCSDHSRASVWKDLERAEIDPSSFMQVHAGEACRILKELGPLKEKRIGEIFVIGEDPFDMLSAKQTAGVIPIGLYRDRPHASRLEEAGAWFLVSNLSEAIPFLHQAPVAGSISIVLLAFNEGKVIGKAIEDVRRFGRLYAPDYEVVVVDDGSTDGTAQEIQRLSAADLRVVTHLANRGMGASMRDGYEIASKTYIAPLPGDRQVRAQALVSYLPEMAPDRVVLSTYTNPPSGFWRAVLSVLFRFVTRWIGGFTVDFAGTYLFHRDQLKKIVRKEAASDTFVYSFELLEQFRKLGCSFEYVKISPFPRERGGSREAKPNRMVNVFCEVLKSRLRRERPSNQKRRRV